MVLLSFHLSYLQAIVMGALQGVAELFPISSLGHSILVPAWLGGSWKDMVTSQDSTANSPFLAFIVALHVATAIALVVSYWRDWVQVVLGIVDIVRTRGLESARSRLAALLIIATIPVGILGIIADKKLRHLFGNPRDAAIFLTINGVILLVVEQLTRRSQRRQGGAHAAPISHGGSDAEDFANLGFGEATVIGASQALALLPGISRSGVTISAGLLRGLDHARATHFAFLLATPVILGAGLLKVPELFKPENSGIHGQVLVGSIAAFVAALVAVAFLARYMKTRTLYPFVVYCLVAGVVSLIHFA
ncbi:MAG: undecaprenyl-diphosphate phosphatase [Marmoricola sp.]